MRRRSELIKPSYYQKNACGSFCLCKCSGFAGDSFKKIMVYEEAVGIASFLSVHYERQILRAESVGLHVGIGLGDSKPTIPLGTVYLFHLRNTKSFIETGANCNFCRAGLVG